MFKKITAKYKQIMEQAEIESQLEKKKLREEKAKRTEKWNQDKAVFKQSISKSTRKQCSIEGDKHEFELKTQNFNAEKQDFFNAAKQDFFNDLKQDLNAAKHDLNAVKQDFNDVKQDFTEAFMQENETKIQDLISTRGDLEESADVFKEFTKLNKTKLSPADYGPEYLELWKREQAITKRQKKENKYTEEDYVELKLIVKRKMAIYKQHLNNNQKIAEERAKQKRIKRENKKQKNPK